MFKSLDEILDDLMRGLGINGEEQGGEKSHLLNSPMRGASEGQPHAIKTGKKDGELNPRQVREVRKVKQTHGITQAAYLNRRHMPPAPSTTDRRKHSDN